MSSRLRLIYILHYGIKSDSQSDPKPYANSITQS
jgi:hypothetical protein